MKRLLPPKAKHQITLGKGITFFDILICSIALAIAIIIYFSGLPKVLKYILAISVLVISFSSVVTIVGDKKGFYFFTNIFKYFLRRKKMNEVSINDTGIKIGDNGIVDFNGQKSIYIEIEGIDFFIQTEKKQDYIINVLSDVYKITKNVSISKISKPLDYSEYVNQYNNKKIYWQRLSETSEDEYTKSIGKQRAEMLEQQLTALNYRQDVEPIMADTFYLQIYDYAEDEELMDIAIKAANIYNSVGISAKILGKEDVEEYYRYFYNYTDEYSRSEEIMMPKIQEKYNSIYIDGERYAIVTFDRLPSSCVNAWTWQLFEIGAKVVANISKTDTTKMIKAINHSIIEIESRYSEQGNMQSMSNQLEEHYFGLQELLQQLQRGNQFLHNVGFYVLFPYENLSKVEEIFATNNIIADRLYFRQLEAYLDMQPYCFGKMKSIAKISKNIQTASVSAMFPYVTHPFMDKNGFYLGDSYYPVYWDFFANLSGEVTSRTNANCFIIGKSGNGKSFATKLMLKNLACSSYKKLKDDGSIQETKTRVFVLDPDNEYDHLAKSLGGEWIDMASVSENTRINPFQIFPSLDSTSNDYNGELSTTRQFLEQFFTVAAPNLDSECRSPLNKIIEQCYFNKNIDERTDYKKLKPSDYPTMDDAYQIAYDWYIQEKHDYERIIYKKILNMLEDFKSKGLYANLWCGETTLDLSSDKGFIVLNFQSLFANGNTKVANAQMLLVMRILDVEIMRNKAVNLTTGSDNRIVIAIDEAHRFIDPKFPVALDFMSTKTKQIRKYNGLILTTTQSVEDLCRSGDGSDLSKKAGDVINGCQYTFMFGINPKDLNSVKELYKNYNGGLTENELDSLTNANRGDALVLVDANTRFNMHIYPMVPEEIKYIEKVKEEEI